MATDLEDRFVSHVEALERLVEECADGNEELGERLRERLDAAMPALDDMQDEIHKAGPSDEREAAEGEGE